MKKTLLFLLLFIQSVFLLRIIRPDGVFLQQKKKVIITAQL